MAELYHLPGVRTVWWEAEDTERSWGAVGLLDQSLLPQQVVVLHLHHEEQVADAIRFLKVRGAPAIGVTAAFGMALAFCRLAATSAGSHMTREELEEQLHRVASLLASTRPTAVNLFWAIERMRRCAQRGMSEALSLSELAARLLQEARTIAAEDVEACQRMGEYGAELIADGATLLTHCNAGALAASGLGTGLAPIYVARHQGKRLHVFVDETRPVLQGARLTAWELQQAGVPLTLITDTMAGHFMHIGKIDAVFVGADRIAANGDVANKIGTYSVAVLAYVHQIPLYVVAPCSTVDLALSSGEEIPIEQRAAEEVTMVAGVPIAPEGVAVANPAFDVTPARYIAAIITEQGVARAPYQDSLRRICIHPST